MDSINIHSDEDDDKVKWRPKRTTGKVSPCINRIKRDINEMVNSPPPGIYGYPEEDDINIMHILIIGPKGTPYQGGMFSFVFDFTKNYPLLPPRLKCTTSCGNGVRFHPNIYANGMVCLSILGTYPGPFWTPVITAAGVTLSIQSLLNEKPFYNEPGFKKLCDEESSLRYNKMVQHETIRVAVCDVYEKIDKYPEYFAEKIKETFDENYDHYVNFCKENLKLDGHIVIDPFDLKRLRYSFKNLLEKLESFKPSTRQEREEKVKQPKMENSKKMKRKK